MHRKRLIAVVLIVALEVLLNAPVFAQEIGNTTRGWKLAVRTCSDCRWVRHAEKAGSLRAPTFSAIANTKGMSVTGPHQVVRLEC